MALRLRLSLTFSLVVAAAIACLGAILYVTMQQTLAAEMDRRLQVRADEVQFAIWPGPDSPNLADLSAAKLDLSPLAEIDAPGLYVQILDSSGLLLATSDSLQGNPLPVDKANFESALRGKPSFTDVAVGGDKGIRVLSVPVTVQDHVAAVLQVSQSREPLKDTLSWLRRLLLIIGSATVLATGLAGWFVSYRGLKPLSVISRRAADIAARRDFGRRVDWHEGGGEIGELASTIDYLLGQVDETLQAHRQFVADTSHELRNPLLALRANVHLLERVHDPAEREECVAEIDLQVQRMSRLVSDLLVLAQVETGLVLDVREVDLPQVVEGAVREARLRAPDHTISIEQLAPLRVQGDAGRLSQVLNNLLDNALKYTPAGGHVGVALTADRGGACISVRDTGEGIAEADLAHIFERAYRAVPGRLRSPDGYGLGLPIVKHLTEAHGGQVSVQSRPGSGSVFAVWLPGAVPLRPPGQETSRQTAISA